MSAQQQQQQSAAPEHQAGHAAQPAAAATQQQLPATASNSTANPWALFGADAPSMWQQLDTSAACSSAGTLGKGLMLQSTDSMLARLDIRPDSALCQSPGTTQAADVAGNRCTSGCSSSTITSSSSSSSSRMQGTRELLASCFSSCCCQGMPQ
jgi:hypothetical protein